MIILRTICSIILVVLTIFIFGGDYMAKVHDKAPWDLKHKPLYSVDYYGEIDEHLMRLKIQLDNYKF